MIWLNDGSNSDTSPTASITAMLLSKIDSPRNCRINALRRAPEALRTPTSRARRADRAVARFIKLMQAINRMKKATAPNR